MPERKTVHVSIDRAPYDVLIQPGLLEELGADLTARLQCHAVGIIADAGLPAALIEKVTAGFPAGVSITTYRLPSGEHNKSLDRVREAYDRLLDARIDRQTPILALGGGVTGDVAGFVAATILRGVPLVQVPTTLLAMVDSSVGGKVGVNHGSFKNMVGAFKQPAVVYCDPAALVGLPPRELSSGLAECIKHAVIRDAAMFEQMEREIDRVFQLDMAYLTDLVTRNVAIKAAVVQNDVHERGERAHLNFGHTFGHAIETVSNHEYTHGEAIALGMCAASFVAERIGLLEKGTRGRIARLLSRAALPTSGLDLEDTVLYSAMLHDKKVSDGRIRLVLPDEIGKAVVRDDVPRDLIIEAINSLRG